MSDFPFPAEPTVKEVAFENGVIRWVTLILPFIIIGKILGLLLIVAVLIAANYNILNWVE
jgi:hypothetical protein